MRQDRLLRGLLGLIAFLLIFLVAQRFLDRQEVEAHPQGLDRIEFTAQSPSVACSADGQWVYVAGTKAILVSGDHGRKGSWQIVLMGK
ncbi:MAG: hypothetical protein HY650_08045 [Acidobacteria bacterium]|nr:hypothetical protein [Acidobacteriota bacterium]